MQNKYSNRKPTIVIASVELNSIGGIATYVKSMAQSLLVRGWNVHCIATNNRGDAFEKFECGISCHDLSKLPLNIKKIFTAAALINQINPEILLLNNCSLLHYALPLLNSSIKSIAVLHSNDPYFYDIASLFPHRISHWIAPAYGLQKEFKRYLPKKYSGNISVIPHGINTDIFKPNEIASTNKCIHKISFVGFVAHNKGADLLPDIIRKVIEVHSSAQFTIVGYGPLRERLEEQLREKDVIKNCTFTGPLSNHAVALVLRNSDIFLLPTRIEGFGLVIAEAMMSGAVPVVTRLPGVTDTIVTDKQSGLLVDLDHVDNFSSAIINLLSNRDNLILMKRNALLVARKKFKLSRMINDYEKLFAMADDRSIVPRRHSTGWFFETMREMMRKDATGIYRVQKKLGTVKKLFQVFV